MSDQAEDKMKEDVGTPFIKGTVAVNLDPKLIGDVSKLVKAATPALAIIVTGFVVLAVIWLLAGAPPVWRS